MKSEEVMSKPRIEIALIALIVLVGNHFYGIAALENDREQNVSWNADQAKMNPVGELRILDLIGNVKVIQGSLEITGNHAVFEYGAADNELKKITVTGSPVHYRQQLDMEESMVIGTSDTLMFYTDEVENQTILELIGKAHIESPDSTMSCAAITYLADQDLIREAVGPCEGVLSPTSN
jgi:lipopolysaccharide transport protein LptA